MHQSPGIHDRIDQVALTLTEGGDLGQRQVTLLPGGSVVQDEKCEAQIEKTEANFATRGFFDLQVNGFAGIDFNRADVSSEEIDVALADMALTGVGTVLPTLITNSHDTLVERLKNLDAAVSASCLGPLMVAGYHIEGPFLSPTPGFCGAHDPSMMSGADVALIDRLEAVTSRPVLLVTVAPETEGATDFIRAATKRGIAVSVGHSAANPDQLANAVQSGARFCTHLGNGLPQHLPKTDNPIFWQLAEDGLTAMFIADGIHIPKPALKSMLRAKGPEKTILVTDAVAAAGSQTQPGTYSLGDVKVELAPDRSVRIPGTDHLAGSSVTMDRMLRNMINWYGYSVSELITLMRDNPLRLFNSRSENLPIGINQNIIEWQVATGGPVVQRAHIGPYTIEPTKKCHMEEQR